jgi:hypothetical protein
MICSLPLSVAPLGGEMRKVYEWFKQLGIEILGHLILIFFGHAQVDDSEVQDVQ